MANYNVSTADAADPNVLLSGDIIGFQVDGLGLLCTPSFNEPIPEQEERVSHLRISTTQKRPTTADYRRCMFLIENDSGERSNILFGSSVKLSHHPTGLAVIASTVEDDGYNEGKLRCVFLTATVNIPSDSLVHKWIVTPRYKLREEGDPVRHNDYVILRNAQYKHLCLSSFPAKRTVAVPTQLAPFTDQMVGLCTAAVVNSKPGLNVILLRKAITASHDEGGPAGPPKGAGQKAKETAEAAEEKGAVTSSDFVRIIHREYRGHLVVRTDDEVELQSSVMPLGATTRKRGSRNLDNNLGVFLRTFSSQQPREQLDFPSAYSSQGVWQIITTEVASESVAVHNKLKFGTTVRLRHVITGQYLCVRPLLSEDTDKLKQFCSFCIPAQAPNDDPDDPSSPVSPRSRERRKYEDAIPPEKLVPATVGNPAPAQDAAAMRSPTAPPAPSAPPASPPIKLCVDSVRADDLNSTDWTGKHRNSIALSLTTAAGVWTLRSKRSSAPGNVCVWEFDKLSYESHFTIMESELPTCAVEIAVYREHAISGRTLIGQGRSLIPHVVVACDADEAVDMGVQLTEPGTANPAGVVVVSLIVNALLSKEESRVLEQKKNGTAPAPGLMNILGLKSVLGPNRNDPADDGKDGAKSPRPDGAYTDSDSEGAENSENNLRDLLDGGAGLSAANIAATNWVVATSSVPDKYTKFNLLIVDRKGTVAAEDDIISYNERFVFEHAYSRQRMKLSTLLGMESQTTWWEYKGDVPLVPDPFKEGSIIDSEVCQFEPVEESEIRDILYGCRFLQLARAATTALQLTPRSSQLFMPLFRHFHNSLLSLTLWTLGAVGTDATLCAENTTPPEVKKMLKGKGAVKTLVSKLGLAGEKILQAVPGSEHLVAGVQQGVKGVQKGFHGVQQGVHEGLALLGIDTDLMGSDADGDFDEDPFGDGPNSGLFDDDDFDTDSESNDDGLDGNSEFGELDGGFGNAAGLQMNIYSPGSQYRVLGTLSRRQSRRRKQREAAVAAAKAVVAAETSTEEVRVSSLSPWIGRRVPRAVCKGRGKAAVPVDTYVAVEQTPLQGYAASKLEEFIFKDLLVNEVLLRRQMILMDMQLVDQLVHFLNVLFQLQRAASITHDERMREQFNEVPPLILACSVQINKLLRACVFKNDKVALKLISVQGSFLAMISQKIQGWEPPIEAILLQTCKEEGTEDIMYGCVGSINSQNDSLLDSSMSILSSAKFQEADAAEEEEDTGAAQTAGPQDTFSIEPILMDAISANDVRQVVEQMHELHLKRDPSALKILGLLTLLCSSGRAKKYFQNLLINAIAIQDHEDYSLTGDFVQRIRPSSLQTNCMLFFTQFADDQWQVKFNSPFSFPSLPSKNQEQLRHKLEKEGNSLKKLFAYYNTDDNAVLDVMESFELLEDLGLGGPFLYKEIRYLESSTVWGFASWWCYRSGFYYPASSISQCQLSPVQAIEVMGEKMTPALMELEMRRSFISEQAVATALDPAELLNSRIPGMCIVYEESKGREGDSLSIVEDYVRSLGQPGGRGGSGKEADGEGDDFEMDMFGARLIGRSGKQKARSPSRPGVSFAPPAAAAAAAASEPSCEWVPFSSALDDSYEESVWFRLSLNLLAELCKDRNAYTQRIVGSILPAECLLAVLEEDRVHYVEKGILCKLVANVYVDHKLVFPTRFCPFNTDTIYLGFKEDVLNPPITMGKLFNAQSRTRFEGEGAEDGTELRRRLFRHMSEKITALQLVSRSRAKTAYFGALLSLFKLLMVKGFFQEPEYCFLESNKTPDDFGEGSTERRRRASIEQKMQEEEEEEVDRRAFNMAAVERMMVEKLNYITLAQKCTVDFEEITTLDDDIANEKHDLLHGVAVAKKPKFPAKSGRRFRRRKRVTADLEATENMAAQRARARRTMDRVRDNFSFFDVLFADQVMSDVVRSVVDILSYIHDINQMLRLARCWNYIVNAKLAMTERAYSMNMMDLSEFVPKLQMGHFLEAVYDEFRSTEPVPRYVEAVFSTTLYKDYELRRRALELLDRQLSMVRDGQHMFEHLSLVSKGHKAFLYRLSSVYEEQLLGYVHQIMSAPTPTNAYLLERLTFCVENLRALHFSTFLDRLDHTSSDEEPVHKIRRTTTALKREARRLQIDARNFRPDGKPEQDCMSYLQRPIPCPTGPDDFFELDLERTIMQEDAAAALFAHFDEQHQFVDLAMPEATVDCDVTMARLGAELIRLMLVLTRAPLYFPWHALYDSEKFLVDQVLSFLAEVGYNSNSLIDAWYPTLSELLMSYFPESLGCGKMAISVLRRCRAAHSGKDAFSRQIVRTIVHHNLVGTALCSSILTAILQSEDLAAVNFAAGFMLSRIPDFTGNFNFRTPPAAVEGDQRLSHRLHSILQPLSLCFSSKMDIPESVLAALRVPLSADFCCAYLQCPGIPLYLKTSICKISVWLHSFKRVPIETFALEEVRLVRKLFSVDAGIDLDRSTQFCRDFLFQGVVSVVKKRILDTKILSVGDINDSIVFIIAEAEEFHCRNTVIAKLVGTKLREYFFTRAGGPTPVSTPASRRRTADALTFESDVESDDGATEQKRAGLGDDLHVLVDMSVLQCVMVLLNVLRLKNGHMMKALHTPQKVELIVVCMACRILMSKFPERVMNPQVGEGLRTADFESMIERLDQVIQGMIVQLLSRAVEKHIAGYYEAQLTHAAKKQFAATLQQASEKAVKKKRMNPLQMLQECFTNKTLSDERSRFQNSMALAVVFPVGYLVQTPYFLFLKRCMEGAASFIDIGGDLLFGDWKTPVVKSRAFAGKFKRFTDYELWLRGEGRYIQSLLQHLGRVRCPTDAEYNLLHLLSALLLHGIEEIRQSAVLSLNMRLAMVETETRRLRRLQLTMDSLGAQSLLTIVLGNIHNSPTEAYVWLYAPLVLSFINEMISWGNRDSQQNILSAIGFYIAKSKPPEMNCLLGLRAMIRKCNLEIAYCSTDPTEENNRLKNGYPDSEHTKILRSVKQLFTFVGMFCKGDNLHAQLFFSAGVADSKQYVDLVLELCLLTNSVLSKFTSMIEYLRNAAFYERLGPLVWESKDASKRRFLAWHHPSNNILLFTQYMFTVVSMLDGLLSMCCEETAGSVQHALSKCPEVLEFAGLMQLEAVSRLQARFVAGMSTGKVAVYWSGGDPFRFYRTYASNLSLSEIADGDPENEMILETLKKWAAMKQTNAAKVFGGVATLQTSDFLTAFGVSHELYVESARRMEEKCLAMILAYFDVAPPHPSLEMASRFNDGLLMQNMNCTFQKIFNGGTAATDKHAPSAVAYTSLLETIGIHFPETNELLDAWEESCKHGGHDPRKVYGVVELLGKSGRLRRLYFPVPTFVSQYWPYPEVQKMKESIVMHVNRQSPEEKLADFLQQMQRLITVMKRQERLRSWLTFPLHAFFGGKTTEQSQYLPNQRMIALILTLILNIYFCYYSSLSDPFSPSRGSYISYWIRYEAAERVLTIIQAVHLGLNASLTLSRLLNSDITDELFQQYHSDSPAVDTLLKLAVSPLAAGLLVYDTIWFIIMLIFSFLAFYFNLYWLYVPCLLDVAFQFTFMNFLYEAVALNAGKIWYTLLLAFLCLYFYSVVAGLYLSGQYSLDNHVGCDNVVACFKLHLDYGLYNVPDWENDGYISPSLPFPFLYGTLLARVLGTAYNVSYVILINLVLQSIISGLIIDTFSQLREENEAVLQDISDKCFICSIDRDEFEQAGIPFVEHTKEEHNMWHYVWFKIYLDSKDPLTYSSSENHAADNFHDTQSFLRIMPIKKSVTLNQKKGEQEMDEKLDEKLNSLLVAVSRMGLWQSKLSKSVGLLRRANARIELRVNQQQQHGQPQPPAADSARSATLPSP